MPGDKELAISSKIIIPAETGKNNESDYLNEVARQTSLTINDKLTGPELIKEIAIHLLKNPNLFHKVGIIYPTDVIATYHGVSPTVGRGLLYDCDLPNCSRIKLSYIFDHDKIVDQKKSTLHPKGLSCLVTHKSCVFDGKYSVIPLDIEEIKSRIPNAQANIALKWLLKGQQEGILTTPKKQGSLY